MSEQTERNIEAIRKGYAAFAAGDVDTLMNLFDDDIEWVQPGASAISGTYHGKGEFAELLGRLAEKNTSVTVKRLLADGDMVVALTEVTSAGQTSEDADVFTLRDGKTVRAQIFGDTAMLERVYGAKQTSSAG
jgi:ketosteroid isomerase-like protein